MRKQSPSRLSYAHSNTDLPHDPFAAKLREARIKRLFEAQSEPEKAIERQALQLSEAERRRLGEKTIAPAKRASRMVQQDRPHPAAKPSPSLARGPDAASFNARWHKEKREAQLSQAIRARDGLVKNRQDLDHIEAAIPSARPLDHKDAERTLFKLQRRFEEVQAQAKGHTRTCRRIERDV